MVIKVHLKINEVLL